MMLARSIVVVLVATGLATAEPAKKPKLSLGIPSVTGALDARALGAVLARNTTKLLACYKIALEKRPDLRGTATATFTIEADGKVTGVAATGMGEDVGACIASTIGKLAFDRPRDGKPARVTYPLGYDKKADDGGAFASLTGSGRTSGLDGNDADTPNGGTGWGTIGTGRYGKIGHGSGTGSGYGTSRGGMRGRPSKAPTVGIGPPTSEGDLDKAIIRRYIRRHIQKVQYCYEKRLVVDPSLAGTVTAEFTIGVDGLVSSSTASGVHSEVASCLAEVVKAIEFPRPRSGAQVRVKYPFIFRPADAPAK